MVAVVVVEEEMVGGLEVLLGCEKCSGAVTLGG